MHAESVHENLSWLADLLRCRRIVRRVMWRSPSAEVLGVGRLRRDVYLT